MENREPLTVRADRRSFTVMAFGEVWFTCPVCIAVDADGKQDRDEAFLDLPVLQEERSETGSRYVWRTSGGKRNTCWKPTGMPRAFLCA